MNILVWELSGILTRSDKRNDALVRNDIAEMSDKIEKLKFEYFNFTIDEYLGKR